MIDRKKQAAALTIPELREVYKEAYPKNPVWKCEKWISYIVECRKRKGK